jgi:hypothetical protein
MRRDMLVDATAALCTVVRLDPGAPHGLAAEEDMLGTAFALVRLHRGWEEDQVLSPSQAHGQGLA